MPLTLFVTGVPGHVGSEIVAQLATTDAVVRAGVRNPKPSLNLNNPNAVAVPFDYDDAAGMEAAFQGVDHLYMNCTQVDPKFKERMMRMIETAEKVGVKRIIHHSQYAANVKPGMIGTEWHSDMEAKTEASGIPYSIIAPDAFMENVYTRYARDIQTKNALIVPAGEARVAFIDVRDIAAVAVALLTQDGHEGQSFPITGPESLSFQDLADTLTRVLGRSIRYIDQSDEEFRQTAKAAGMTDNDITLTLEGYRVEKEGHYAAVTNVVQQVTGCPPRSFEEWLRDNAGRFAARPDAV